MKLWSRYLIIIALFLILDSIWFNFSIPSYAQVVQKIQNQPMVVSKLSAIVAYLLLGLGILYFVLPKVLSTNGSKQTVTELLQKAIRWGGLLGLIIYGVFDMTNMTIFRDWTLPISLIDTLWGVVVSSTVAFLSALLIQYFNL